MNPVPMPSFHTIFFPRLSRLETNSHGKRWKSRSAANVPVSLCEDLRSLSRFSTPEMSNWGIFMFKVLVTGATGFLGGELLMELSKVRSIEKIVCLVRAANEDDANRRSEAA